MENQNKVYQEVAEECSQYCPCGCDHSVKNVSTGDDTKAPSCLNCKHFSVSEQHCQLDLYDQIVTNLYSHLYHIYIRCEIFLKKKSFSTTSFFILYLQYLKRGLL